MDFSRTPQALIFSGIDSVFAALLRRIPAETDPKGNQAAEHRIFSAPSDDEEFNAEWQEYVRPELVESFGDAVKIVRADLRKMTEKGTPPCSTLRIPPRHLEAWLSALNQARLVLASRHELDESDLESTQPESENPGEREVAIFQVHLYGFLQEIILRELE